MHWLANIREIWEYVNKGFVDKQKSINCKNNKKPLVFESCSLLLIEYGFYFTV